MPARCRCQVLASPARCRCSCLSGGYYGGKGGFGVFWHLAKRLAFCLVDTAPDMRCTGSKFCRMARFGQNSSGRICAEGGGPSTIFSDLRKIALANVWSFNGKGRKYQTDESSKCEADVRTSLCTGLITQD